MLTYDKILTGQDEELNRFPIIQ